MKQDAVTLVDNISLLGVTIEPVRQFGYQTFGQEFLH